MSTISRHGALTDHLDYRVIGVAFFFLLVVVMTLIGDRGVFLRETANDLECWLSLPTALFYRLTSDRLISNLASGILWGVLLGTPAIFLFRALENYIFSQSVKKMVDQEKKIGQLRDEMGGHET